jgi:hypothetical protein
MLCLFYIFFFVVVAFVFFFNLWLFQVKMMIFRSNLAKQGFSNSAQFLMFISVHYALTSPNN